MAYKKKLPYFIVGRKAKEHFLFLLRARSKTSNQFNFIRNCWTKMLAQSLARSF
jgi:hypothetical protein